MRLAALVPTRDRPETAARAVGSFLDALEGTGLADSVRLVMVDDSGDAAQAASLASFVDRASAGRADAEVVVVPDAGTGPPTLPARGPGAARNRGLSRLREIAPDADVTIMFDDDVCFADTVYRNVPLKCDGVGLLLSALDLCRTDLVVAGCPYVGRQDLSILEHAGLAPGEAPNDWHIPPSMDRAGVENVAPGGISTAFLALRSSPVALPDMPGHYNEDYVWLYALQRAGWPLRRVAQPLIHAPPGEVAVTQEGLDFQIHGEIVWLAVLEHERFPVDDHLALAAAVAEIASDLRNALRDHVVRERVNVRAVISAVISRYDAIGREFERRRPGLDAARLVADIRQGLALRPSDFGK